MQVVTIKGQFRDDLGKNGAKKIRKEGAIPCVMYAKEEVIHFSTTPNEVKDLIYTPEFKLAEIVIDGKSFRCIVKETQFHPITDAIMHMDFLILTEDRPVKVKVPVRFKGTSPGVKSGGKLVQNVRLVKIKALPEHLVDTVYVNISSLEMGQSIRVRDIEPGEGIEMLSAPGIPIATVELPRAMRSAQSAAAKAAKGAEAETEVEAEAETEA